MKRLALILMLALPAAASAAAPPPLSKDRSPANARSAVGSGNFGRWGVDRYGLPRFRYTMNHLTDPRAEQAEIEDSRLAYHQLGNDSIIANAANSGQIVLWSQARLMQWVNRFDPQNRHYSGGFGYLKIGDHVASTHYDDGGGVQRDFGVGYYRKRVALDGVVVTEDTFTPYGDDPLLVDQVTLRNTTGAPVQASWFEYWDVNPFDQQIGAQTSIPTDAMHYDAATRTLTVKQAPKLPPDPTGDPLSIFAAALNGPDGGVAGTIDGFFGDGTHERPAAVTADALDGGLAGAAPGVLGGDALFAYRAPVTIRPHGKVTLRYVYGIAHGDDVDGLVAKYRSAPGALRRSERSWGRWLPRADFGAKRRWVARELQWDAYLLRSSTVYEELCNHHTITQGGYYQFDTGANLGFRSWPHYGLPMTYAEPEIAREILRYSIRLQPDLPRAAQLFPYGTGRNCSRVDLGTSNDLDFWLLLLAGEYGLGMRDPGFFDEQLPYADNKRNASAWQHIKEAFGHQESLLGPHGGYIMGATGDWNDFATEFEAMTESMLVPAQLAYAYPKLAELADLRGDPDFAADLRAAAARNVATMQREWTGKGWFSRGYSAALQVGTGVIFEEPQPWAMLAGIPDPGQTRTLVANIRRFLGGEGAPHGPTRFGTAMSPARDDPEVTELGAVPAVVKAIGPFAEFIPSTILRNASQWPGGIWFDLNGHLTWAYTRLQDVLPNARRLAWSEYTRNTLARHATLYPDHWQGTISIDDACHGWYAADPERCGTGLSSAYSGQITEQPTWMVMNALRLAGVTVTETGYNIEPAYPFRRFSVRMARIGVARGQGVLRGYLKPVGADPYTITVHVPAGARRVRAWVNGRRTQVQRAGDTVVLPAAGSVDWAVRY